jgi:hypothetical protein
VAVLVLDRVLDASVLAPLAWIARVDDPRVAALALFGLGASFVASYERARGRSLRFPGSERVEYLAVRDGALVLALLTGAVEPFLWIFAAVAGAAVAVRWWNVRRRAHAG